MISVYIPLLCFHFYTVVNPKSEGNVVLFSIIGGLYWLLGSAGILVLIIVFGSRVSEKICSVQDIMQTVEVPDGDEGKLLLFLFYLNAGEPRDCRGPCLLFCCYAHIAK
ncbi:hypothetical protein OS493_019240 [Desmophyllum pertusum]|uniref:Uncharacterized protein n=1 Tax=Desmophyllum pertusum TaxID=174260 RepID=A0A9W9YBP4_9CNID|nr:hypothetical protein OS493_019240 [Desmophyllum pertusum]